MRWRARPRASQPWRQGGRGHVLGHGVRRDRFGLGIAGVLRVTLERGERIVILGETGVFAAAELHLAQPFEPLDHHVERRGVEPIGRGGRECRGPDRQPQLPRGIGQPVGLDARLVHLPGIAAAQGVEIGKGAVDHVEEDRLELRVELQAARLGRFLVRTLVLFPVRSLIRLGRRFGVGVVLGDHVRFGIGRAFRLRLRLGFGLGLTFRLRSLGVGRGLLGVVRPIFLAVAQPRDERAQPLGKPFGWGRVHVGARLRRLVEHPPQVVPRL
ncbi:MAG: hypothetical protein N4A39_14925, partial [Roseicyclus sp.]|nr:hypothetical protein [Roseicyclus sp.]